MSTCIGCSQEIPASAAYCPRCGTPNPEAPTIPTPTEGGVEPHPQIPVEEVRSRLQAALGRGFVVEQLLGEGGFAYVFAALERKLSRRIAVKVLRPELTTSQSTVQRFVREAESAASLNHPHILPIFFVGEGQGLVYFGMPLVEGETLESLVGREGQLPEDEVTRMGSEIADALAEAHAHGLVHRDVKPANVLLQGARRRVLVTDFGIAKAAAASGGKLTGTGVVIGSPHYMSPEQAAGSAEVDHRSDIYSLGVVLWQMLAGAVPFDGPDSQSILAQHITQKLPALRARRPGVSPVLAQVIERCCAKKPQLRDKSAGEVADALRSGRATLEKSKSRAFAPRPRTALLAAAALALIVGTALLLPKLRSARVRTTLPPVQAEPPRSAAPMVAVLPFDVNLSGDTAQQARQSARILTNTLGLRYGVETVDPNRLLGLWAAERRSLAALPDSNAAFVYRQGANQLVIGSAFEAGRQIRVGVDVYDTRRYARIGHYELDGGLDAFIPLLDQLAESVAVAFCKQPEFNPRSLCFDSPARPARPVEVQLGRSLPVESLRIHVLVSRDGSFSDVGSSGVSADLMAAALPVLRTVRFDPARKAGRPVQAWTSVEVRPIAAEPPATAPAPVADQRCASPTISLANAGRECYDSRPVPRVAPLLAAPGACRGVPSAANILMQVSATGEVIGQPTVSRRSSCDAFTAAAQAFSLDLPFQPALKAGRPVAAWVVVLVRPAPTRAGS